MDEQTDDKGCYGNDMVKGVAAGEGVDEAGGCHDVEEDSHEDVGRNGGPVKATVEDFLLAGFEALTDVVGHSFALYERVIVLLFSAYDFTSCMEEYAVRGGRKWGAPARKVVGVR